ncbi:hypothetical protein GCM10027294_52650 [Marinactinospora endophytica]
MSDFGARVRAALAERGMSLRAAARAIHYDPAFLSRVLSGRQRPSPQLAQALDDLLDAEGALAGLAATLTPDDRDRIAQSIARPSRVDAETVRAVADVLAAQRRLDDAIGSAAMIPATMAQVSTLTTMSRAATGPHADELRAVAAEWAQFAGWLHAAIRSDVKALRLLDTARSMAREAGAPLVETAATSFRGYVARQRGRADLVVTESEAALHVDGAHPAQRAFDTLQQAQAFADLGDRDTATRLLDQAATLVEAAGDPPSIVYWYSPDFFATYSGLVHHSLGNWDQAADLLETGLAGLPPDQRDAEWTHEYRQALTQARAAR